MEWIWDSIVAIIIIFLNIWYYKRRFKLTLTERSMEDEEDRIEASNW